MAEVVTQNNDDPAPLAIGGRRIGAHLRACVSRVSRTVVGRLVAELPEYAELPPEQVTGDIAEIVRHNFRVFADVLEQRRPARDEELALQRASAAQRAEEGVPLDAIINAYQIGFEIGWQEISAGAQPYDLDDLQAALRCLLRFQRQLTSAVCSAYLEARLILDSQDHGDRHALATALLTGAPLDRVVQRPAPEYVVLSLSLAGHPDEKGGGQRARIAARRKIRRVRLALDRFAREPALAALDGGGGTVLLPVATAPPPWSDLCDLIERTADAAGAAVTAAAATAVPEDIPDAVAQTSEIVELVRRTDRPPGLYRIADVLLEFQLSRATEALPGLAGLLRPLEDKPDLLHTLTTYLDNDLDRRKTGAALHIHPNTVNYRIRQVTRLTGLSLSRPADLHHIHAALVARRACES